MPTQRFMRRNGPAMPAWLVPMNRGNPRRLFDSYVKPPNQKEYRRDRRLARNQRGKRKVVVIAREHGGNPVPTVFNSESQAASFIRARIAKGTVVRDDEAASWDDFMSVSRSRESIVRKHTASMARALIWLNNTSPACVVPGSAFTTTSPVRISSVTRRSRHSGKTAASRTANRSAAAHP